MSYLKAAVFLDLLVKMGTNLIKIESQREGVCHDLCESICALSEIKCQNRR